MCVFGSRDLNPVADFLNIESENGELAWRSRQTNKFTSCDGFLRRVYVEGFRRKRVSETF